MINLKYLTFSLEIGINEGFLLRKTSLRNSHFIYRFQFFSPRIVLVCVQFESVQFMIRN